MKSPFSRLHRFLHWSIAVVMTFLFVTGFIRQTWMGKAHVAAIIQSKIPDIDPEFAVALAKSIQAPMFEWHVYAAYLMVFLFLIRILSFWIEGRRFSCPLNRTASLRDRFEGLIYVLFYTLIFVNITTGFYHLWGNVSFYRKLSGTIHKWPLYWFPVFILIHFAGVYLAERHSEKKGITSKLIGGDNSGNT